MFFNADQTEGAIAKVAKPQPAQPSQHLNKQQFPGKSSGPADAEGGAAEGAEAAGAGAAEGAAATGAEAGAAGLADLAPLLLL